MPHSNPLNVYKGPNSMGDYFDPDCQPPLPLIELPNKLNPFKQDNVRIYAKMATALPAQNIKFLPALNMLQNNPPTPKDTIIEQSSGSTAVSLGLVARAIYNNENTRIYVSNKIGPNRIRQLRFFGLNVELYGGPSQPPLGDPRGSVAKSHRLAEADGNFKNPGQYDNENNWRAHARWTGPQLWKQLPEINIFSMAMGSTGCITGTGSYLKMQKPSVKVLGVCFPVGDIVPGPRSLPLVEGCNFPWRKTVDAIEIIGSEDAHRLSMLLSREGIICGPSSGITLKGLYDFLQKAKDAGTLDHYREPETDEISCVFVCCDLPYQHLDAYFETLGEEDFPPIRNEGILSVDTNEYDAGWELSPQDAGIKLYGRNWKVDDGFLMSNGLEHPHSSIAKVLDLRSPEDFEHGHISGAIKAPLTGLTATTSNPYDDGEILQSQWKDLKVKFSEDEFDRVDPRPVIVVCYGGETSRLASALLRSQGIEAYSIAGGASGIKYFSESKKK